MMTLELETLRSACLVPCAAQTSTKHLGTAGRGSSYIPSRQTHVPGPRHSASLRIYPPIPNFQNAPRARRRIDSLFVSLSDPCTMFRS